MERVKLILNYLKDGHSQKELSSLLWDNHGIKIGLSMIEKDLKEIRKNYEANNMFHLAFILMDDNYFENEDEENNLVVQE